MRYLMTVSVLSFLLGGTSCTTTRDNVEPTKAATVARTQTVKTAIKKIWKPVYSQQQKSNVGYTPSTQVGEAYKLATQDLATAGQQVSFGYNNLLVVADSAEVFHALVFKNYFDLTNQASNPSPTETVAFPDFLKIYDGKAEVITSKTFGQMVKAASGHNGASGDAVVIFDAVADSLASIPENTAYQSLVTNLKSVLVADGFSPQSVDDAVATTDIFYDITKLEEEEVSLDAPQPPRGACVALEYGAVVPTWYCERKTPTRDCVKANDCWKKYGDPEKFLRDAR